MTGGFIIIKRAALLVLVWGVALCWGVRLAGAVVQCRQLDRDVKQLNADYQARMDHYTALLAEGERLKGDGKYQVSLLKKQYGYTEPDETPIVVHVGE